MIGHAPIRLKSQSNAVLGLAASPTTVMVTQTAGWVADGSLVLYPSLDDPGIQAVEVISGLDSTVPL